MKAESAISKNFNLQEIFLFYCRQHVMLGKKATFDDIKKEVRQLSLGDFIKFAKDFEIELSKVVSTIVITMLVEIDGDFQEISTVQ